MISAIVTDIEGTTSSISFVKDVLFPYAAKKLPQFVLRHHLDAKVRQQLDEVATQAGCDDEDLETIIRQLLDWIDSDTKATSLKTLQGMIWQKGYEEGDYAAHFYPDAVTTLNTWHLQGVPLYVYSSGSIQAQKLFFRYSCSGDLTGLISGWFDTTTGPKTDTESYLKISESLSAPASEILFLSDIVAELDAARAAGFCTILLARPEDSNLAANADSTHTLVRSFQQIDLNETRPAFPGSSG